MTTLPIVRLVEGHLYSTNTQPWGFRKTTLKKTTIRICTKKKQNIHTHTYTHTHTHTHTHTYKYPKTKRPSKALILIYNMTADPTLGTDHLIPYVLVVWKSWSSICLFICTERDLTFLGFEHFLIIAWQINSISSKNSATVITENPIHSPSWPPMSETKFTNCKENREMPLFIWGVF